MPNFSFLQSKTEYALFAPACMEAEKIHASALAMCAVDCQKALMQGYFIRAIILKGGQNHEYKKEVSGIYQFYI